ncbi:hypothetical protein D3C85_1366560 [compost metagenome]
MITTTTLKNAAFAIEHDLFTDSLSGANYLVKDGAILRRWEPLADDGDAFRLAVVLNISIYQSPFGVDCGNHDDCVTFEGWGEDRFSATRRAIVRAASALGAAL